MSMSYAAGGVATSPPQQQQLPPPKQIRFVNNEGQPPAKRRRLNAACVPFPLLPQFLHGLPLVLVLAHRSGLHIGEVILLIASSIAQMPNVSKTQDEVRWKETIMLDVYGEWT